MDNNEIKIETEFIKLGSLLKYANIVMDGGEAKHLIQSGHVKVDGEVCTQRGKKIYPNTNVVLEINGESIDIYVI